MSAETSSVRARTPQGSAPADAPSDDGTHPRRPWLWGSVITLLAAFPSLLWAASSPDLLTDDFAHLDRLRRLGVWDAAWSWSFEHPARPLLGPYHLVTYGLIGDRPVLHALLMAALNAALAIAIWQYGRRWIGSEVALAAALLFAVAPNRASTRLWFATGNYLLAALIVLVAAHLLAHHRRPVAAAATFAAGVLLFEGVIGLVVGLLVLWTLPAVRQRIQTAALVVVPSLCAAAWMYALSPKRRSGPDPNIEASLSTLGHGLFGSGFWGEGLTSYLGACAFAALVVLGAVAQLPSFSALRPRTPAVMVGIVLTAFSTAPFAGAGVTFAVRGIFDRSNAIPLLGACLLLAGSVELVGRRHRRGLVAGGALLLAYLLSLGLQDVADYADAADEGRLIVERVLEDVPADPSVVVVWPVPEHGTGVAAFIYPGDLDAALRLRYERRPGRTILPWSAEQCATFARAEPDAVGYDWSRRQRVDDVGQLCSR